LSYQSVKFICPFYILSSADLQLIRGRRGRNRMMLPMQSVPFSTDVLSSNLDQGEVYNIM